MAKRKSEVPSLSEVSEVISPEGQVSPNDVPAPEGFPDEKPGKTADKPQITLIQRNDGWCFHFGIVVERKITEVLPVISEGATEDKAMEEAAAKAKAIAEQRNGYADYTGNFKKISTKEL